jgi:hypothetical protein
MGFVIAGAIMGGSALLGGVFGSLGAGKRARAAAREKKKLEGELKTLENNRQAIINPYEGVTSLSDMVTNLSGNLSNPFASLGVATGAAEMQIEEADIALANTLDTLRATGAGAGGATALAQAALQSKKGVSASIEQQETQNQKLRAQGEQQLDQMKMSEAQRVQSGQFGEAQRIQQAGVSGKSFVFGEKERRETEQLNRKQAQITGQQQTAVAERQNATALLSSGITAASNVAMSGLTAG